LLQTLLLALGFMLILEGLLPLFAPGNWRKIFQQILLLEDGQIRFMGVFMVLLGLSLVWVLA